MQDRDHLVSAAAWMARPEAGNPLGEMRWVFAGSRRVDKTTLGAEIDGTLVCVVNFETALIAVDSLHTADNEELWLVANTKAIPPVGTPCTLVIRAPAVTELRAKLHADGPDIQYQLGVLRFRQQRYELARRHLLRADAADVRARRLLAEVLRRQAQ